MLSNNVYPVQSGVSYPSAGYTEVVDAGYPAVAQGSALSYGGGRVVQGGTSLVTGAYPAGTHVSGHSHLIGTGQGASLFRGEQPTTGQPMHLVQPQGALIRSGLGPELAPQFEEGEEELPRLYAAKISANSMAPWLLMREAGIPFELVEVDLTKGETRTPEFTKMNPVGKVPTFTDTDHTAIWESNAILRYICNRFGLSDAFYPRDLAIRGRVDMALDWRQTQLYPNLSKVAYPFLGFSKDHSKVAEAKAALEKDLKVLMDYFLKETPFIGGRKPCIADYAIGLPLLYLYATDFKTPSTVKEYLENLASHCPHWNEVTDDLKHYMQRL